MAIASDLHVFVLAGSWHVPEHSARLIESLQSLGISASTILLPSCGLSHASVLDLQHPDLTGPPPAKPWPNMYDDAEAIHAALVELVNAGRRVLIAAHSYAGLPSSEALTPEICLRPRSAAGKAGGVIGFFALTSFFLPPGMTTVQAVGGKHLPETPVQPSGLQVVINPQHNLFNDFSPQEQEHWIQLLRPQAGLVHECEAKNQGCVNVPCAYLKTTKDVISPIDRQDGIIKGARDMGIEVTEYSIEAGHEALIKHPQECAEFIADFANKCLS